MRNTSEIFEKSWGKDLERRGVFSSNLKKKPACFEDGTHNYFRNEDNQIECRTCTLLKSTIDDIAQQDLGVLKPTK